MEGGREGGRVACVSPMEEEKELVELFHKEVTARCSQKRLTHNSLPPSLPPSLVSQVCDVVGPLSVSSLPPSLPACPPLPRRPPATTQGKEKKENRTKLSIGRRGRKVRREGGGGGREGGREGLAVLARVHNNVHTV